jgi:2-dehydro-3-deoxygalactonokinase
MGDGFRSLIFISLEARLNSDRRNTKKQTCKNRARLIALDWGTSSLRAYLLGESGTNLSQVSLASGVMKLKQRARKNFGSNFEAFEKAFEHASGRWLRALPSLPVVASGMVGSREGWREAPYLSVPMDVFDLWKHLTEIRTSKGATIQIVPGLVRRGELVNVMRGEETQILGALTAQPLAEQKKAWICLPGTHSKWARIKGTTVEDFETFMTGEVYAALSRHTILGRTLKQSASFHPEAFDRGVQVAESAGHLGVLSNVFSVRAFALTEQLTAEEQADYLSGLLIGHEINALSALSAGGGLPGRELLPIVLVAQSSLCMRYRRALELKRYRNVAIVGDATARGLWQIAVRAGLVSERGNS